MSIDNPFDVTGTQPPLLSLPVTPPRVTPSPAEFLLLFLTVIDIVVASILSTAKSPTAWIVGYLLSVVVGVTVLGFYTQSVFHRFGKLRMGVTGRAKFLRILLVIGLVAPALACASRLAVEWSS